MVIPFIPPNPHRLAGNAAMRCQEVGAELRRAGLTAQQIDVDPRYVATRAALRRALDALSAATGADVVFVRGIAPTHVAGGRA